MAVVLVVVDPPVKLVNIGSIIHNNCNTVAIVVVFVIVDFVIVYPRNQLLFLIPETYL